MPRVESHTPSTINGVDFVSTDLDAASAFYTGLFGWETYDMPMPGGDGSTGSSAWTAATRPPAGRCRARWPPRGSPATGT
jgi:predicted enzyme related to lactoylglutathione lyase